MLKEILGIFLLSRLLIICTAYLSNMSIAKGWWFSKFPPPDSLMNMFYKWDSQWYMTVVGNGYSYIPGKESNVGFFPLFPLLVKMLSLAFGNPKLMGFIISNICLFSGAIYLYKLIMLDFKNPNVAMKAIFFMFISPVSFFFSIFYTEGLFLFLAVSSFYYARKKQWLIASILGFFISLTRSVGVFIIIPLIIEYFDMDFKSFKIDFKIIKKNILYLALIPAGLFSHMLYLYFKVNDAFAYFNAQGKGWNRGFVSIPETLKSMDIYNTFYDVIFLGAAVLALVFCIYLFFSRIRLSYGVFSLLFLFLYLSAGLLESMPRYVSVLFPLYLAMSLIADKNKFLDYLFTFFSLMLLTLFTTLFVNGYWMT